MFGVFVSSIKYRVFRDGMAMKINIIAGRMVQIVSISCPSIIYLLNVLFIIVDSTKYIVMMVINIRMIIA
jgi:hypothetical protein